MKPLANPYERFSLDPRSPPDELTRALRERMEDAASEEERAEIRAFWEELTLHPERRLRAALRALPRERAPLPPPPPALERKPIPLPVLQDLLPLPTVEDLFDDLEPPAVSSLFDDPYLGPPEGER